MNGIHICTKKTAKTKETGKTEKKAAWMAVNTQYEVDAEQSRKAGFFGCSMLLHRCGGSL
jgi:hypothetical protein